MTELNETERKNHNRAITIIIFAMFVSAFVSLNSNKFLLSSALYIGMAIVCIFLYLIWSKF